MGHDNLGSLGRVSEEENNEQRPLNLGHNLFGKVTHHLDNTPRLPHAS